MDAHETDTTRMANRDSRVKLVILKRPGTSKPDLLLPAEATVNAPDTIESIPVQEVNVVPVIETELSREGLNQALQITKPQNAGRGNRRFQQTRSPQ